MRKEENNIKGVEDALTHTIKKSNLSPFATSIAEFSVDSFLDNGIFKDLPIVNSITGLWRVGISIKDYFFTKKLICFLKKISEIPEAERIEMIESLENTDQIENVGEKILNLIDKIDSSKKARIAGELFKMYSLKKISINELLRAIYIIESIPLGDLVALKEWNNTNIKNVDKARKSIYISSGLIWYVLDASSTGFNWEERLCGIIAELLN